MLGQAPQELMRRPLSDLVTYLNQRCSTDLQKVRAYFRWLCTRDIESLIKPDPSLDDDNAVLHTLMKTSEKGGGSVYTNLYAEMCQ